MQLFVSDLHLCPTRPVATEVFLDFLAGKARDGAALYILGDLFEYWAGDDDLADPFNHRVVAALHDLAATVPVAFLAGNRDFLVGEAFAAATGARLLEEPTLIELDGQPTLLMHGDTLCTDDHAYQDFRAEVRGEAWRQAFLARPLADRKAEIARLRQLSEAEKRRKTMAIMDVNDETVAAILRAHRYPHIIHGHTHRPGHHWHEVDGHRCERWVLGDWYRRASCLVAESGSLRPLTLPAV